MSTPIDILVGSMSGMAEMMADELAALLEANGREVTIRRMEKVHADSFHPSRLYIICSSTYGTGEVPDNAKPLYEELQSKRPDLHDMLYGVVTLGDSVYPETFAFGGHNFDRLLQSLGATRIGQVLEYDSRSAAYPEDLAADWLRTWPPLMDAAGSQQQIKQ